MDDRTASAWLDRLNAMIVAEAPVGIIVVDADAKIVHCNRLTEDLFGYTKAELIGQAMHMLLPQRLAEVHARHYVEYLTWPQTRSMGSGRDLLGRRKDGSEFVLEVGLRWVAQGERSCVVATIVDISERAEILAHERSMEAELALYRDHLEDLVKQRTAQLEVATRKAEEANFSKSRFLANMSHELRTPMHAISSFASLGKARAVQERSSERIRKYFTRIETAALRLTGLLNNLLNLAKLEAGRRTLVFALYDLAQLCSEAVEEFEGRAVECGIALDFSAPFPVPVLADRDAVVEIMVNLIGNALKFTPAGGRVEVAAWSGEADQHAYVTVSDTGVGLPDGESDLVFGRFEQSSRTKSNAGGTGLGLAICKELVMLHKGSIWAKNRAPAGAVFTVAFPAHQASLAVHSPSGG